jgi:hypothetical protein
VRPLFRFRPTKPIIDNRFAFSKLSNALDRLDEGPFGEIVIDMER